MGNLHHLLLVDYDAVGFLEQRFQGGMQVGYFLMAVFTVDEIVDEGHGPRPVKGVHCDQVFDAGGLEFGQELPHSR